MTACVKLPVDLRFSLLISSLEFSPLILLSNTVEECAIDN
jgi:hypothetical protein